MVMSLGAENVIDRWVAVLGCSFKCDLKGLEHNPC